MNSNGAPQSANSTPHDKPATVDLRSRINYGPETDNFGDLYLPDANTSQLPVLVMIHGGGWQQQYDLRYTGVLALTLTPHGIAVWNIEYRRVGGSGPWPSALADVDTATEAINTVVQQQAGDRLDLGNVHVAGHSAGGQLAAWLAGRHTFAPGTAPGPDPTVNIRSATIMAGVLDMKLAATAGRDSTVTAFLGGTPDQQPDRYRVASPIEQLPIGVPVTALHGDNDRTVSVDQSRNYVAKARSLGDPATLVVLPGVDHGAFGDPKSTAWDAARTHILRSMGR